MKKIKHFPSKLENRARELLEKAPRKLTYKQISLDTGLSEPWLSEFSKGNLKNASAGRLEALYNYLSGTPFNI